MTLHFWLQLVLDGVFAAMAAVGFGAVSNPPLRALGAAALIAAAAHAFRFWLLHATAVHIIPASFLAALITGLLSLWAAHRLHCTMETINFPAILPMIPGIPAYKTMLMLVKFMRCTDPVEAQALLTSAFHNGFTALFILSALVTGMLIPRMLLQKYSLMMTRGSRP